MPDLSRSTPDLRACTCRGDRWPDRTRIVTVGCPIHHLMDDGAPACDHEVRCMCGNFADNRKCVLFLDQDVIAEDGPTCVDAETIVCHSCIEWAEKQAHLTRTDRPVMA